MSVAAVLMPVAQLISASGDLAPKDEDVKAGWTAFAVFLLLIAAVVVLAFSLVKQLRRVDEAKEAGVYGDEPEAAAEPAEPENHSTS